jgi:hypothetical protein
MRATQDGWRRRKRARGKGWEYSFSNLPQQTRTAILLREHHISDLRESREADTKAGLWAEARLESLWQNFNRASQKKRSRAETRLRAIHAVEHLVEAGAGLIEARALVSQQLQREGIVGMSPARIAAFQKQVEGAPRDAWAAVLLPRHTGRTAVAGCSPEAWDWYKQQWLTRRAPSHADTYRRLLEIAQEKGWSIPSGKTFERYCAERISRYTEVFYREGAIAAARMLPPQRRDELVFAAGEAVNGDGLKFDKLNVKFDDGEIVQTATAWFWQDIRTRRILAWRLGKTENTDIFRLATYDLTRVCAPKHVWMDNTRVAANKLMTAGAEHRHRFHDKPDDGMGALLMLGMEPHFTNPDKELGSPGAKPVERAFGQGGLHEMVITNPRLRDRGYSKATAISEHELREVIAEEVARFNAQTKRRTQACGGVLSYNQAWEEGLKLRPPRLLPESQRSILLMCREVVRADSRSGLITLKAGRSDHGVNRYWCEGLQNHWDQKLVALFDPDDLSAGVHLYTLDGTYLMHAEHRPTAAFNSIEDARENQKRKARILKAQKKIAEEERGREQLYQRTRRLPDTPTPAAADTNIVEGNFKRVLNPERDAIRATGTDGELTSADLLSLEIMRQRAREQL